MALRELQLEQERTEEQPELDPDNSVETIELTSSGDEARNMLRSWRRTSVDERALQPRVTSLENSFAEHVNTSVPTLDEIIIRQRGRRRQPAKISWSPIKSPFKTPTKRSSTLHMSLLSPSPKKPLDRAINTSMVLRNSPRKRILVDDQDFCASTSSSNIASSTPTKRQKFTEDLSIRRDFLERTRVIFYS